MNEMITQAEAISDVTAAHYNWFCERVHPKETHMGIPWKKIGKGVLKGLGIAGTLYPGPLSAIIPLVELAEKFNKPGAEKKALVMEALNDEIELLPVDKQDEARALYSAAIDAYVAARNAQAKAEDAYEKAQEFIAAVKAA